MKTITPTRALLAVMLAAAAIPAISQDRAPPVVVTEHRTADQRITAEAVDVLSRNASLAGRIGVETKDRVVTLNGMVTNPGQARLAVRLVSAVEGVRTVQNDLRTHTGRSI